VIEFRPPKPEKGLAGLLIGLARALRLDNLAPHARIGMFLAGLFLPPIYAMYALKMYQGWPAESFPTAGTVVGMTLGIFVIVLLPFLVELVSDVVVRVAQHREAYPKNRPIDGSHNERRDDATGVRTDQ